MSADADATPAPDADADSPEGEAPAARQDDIERAYVDGAPVAVVLGLLEKIGDKAERGSAAISIAGLLPPRMSARDEELWRKALKEPRHGGLSHAAFDKITRETRVQAGTVSRPSCAISTSSGIWAYSPGGPGEQERGVYRWERDRGQDGEWLWLAPLPYIHEVVLRRGRDGRILRRDYRLSTVPLALAGPGAPATLSGGRDMAEGDYADPLDVLVSEDDRVRRAVATAIKAEAKRVGAREVEAVPRWVGDQLSIPPDDVTPEGYDEVADCTESEALEYWARIAREMIRAPKIGLMAGFALASRYAVVERKADQSALVSAYGNGSEGKTTVCLVCAALLGEPTRVKYTWDASAQGIPQRLSQLGCYAIVLDEATTLTPRERQELANRLCRILEGNARLTGNRDRMAGPKSEPGWIGYVIASANFRFMELITNPAMAARIIEIPSPITVDAHQSELLSGEDTDDDGNLQGLIWQCYGWPSRWLTGVSLARFRAAARDERKALPLPAGGIPRRVGRRLANAVAMARIFGDRVGVPELGDAVLDCAREVLAELTEVDHARPATAGDRLLRAILAAFYGDPYRFPRPIDFGGAMDSRTGDRPAGGFLGMDLSNRPPTRTDFDADRPLDHAPVEVGVLTAKLEEIAGDASSTTALKELKRRGILVDCNNGLAHKQWAGRRTYNVYKLRIPVELEPGQAACPHCGYPVAAEIGTHPLCVEADAAKAAAAEARKPAPPAEPATSDEPRSTQLEFGDTAEAPQVPTAEVPEMSTAEASTAEASTASARAARAARAVQDDRQRQYRPATPAGGETCLAVSVSGSTAWLSNGAGMPLPEAAMRTVSGLVAELAHPAHETVLVLDQATLDAMGIGKVRRPEGSEPWSPIFDSMIQAGWHAAGRAVTERPWVNSWTTFAHPQRSTPVRVVIAPWLTHRATKPFPLSHHPDGTPERPGDLSPVDYAIRIEEWSRAIGYNFRGTTATTGVQALKGMLAPPRQDGQRRRGRQPGFFRCVSKEAEMGPRAANYYWHRGRKQLQAEEKAGGYCHSYDRQWAFLANIRSVEIALDPVRTGPLDSCDGLAGDFLIRVPEWPHHDVIPPVPAVAPGKLAVVSHYILDAYAAFDIQPEILDSFSGKRTNPAAFRKFADPIRDALNKLTGTKDRNLAAVAAGLKHMYQSTYKKMDSRSTIIHRPDIPQAIQDLNWLKTCLVAWKEAGIVPSGPNDGAPEGRSPLRVDVDAIYYWSDAQDWLAAKPGAIQVDDRAGTFKAEPDTIPMSDHLEWLASKGDK